MNWYIGQEVTCIHDHSMKVVKRGEIYPLIGIMRGHICAYCCPTGLLVDVGKKNGRSALVFRCPTCGRTVDNDGVWWLSSELFAPLQTASEEADMKEAIEESLTQYV